MTDNKRNSVNSKVATPKTASPTPASKDALEALGKAAGARIKIITTTQTLEGIVYAADPTLGVVAIDITSSDITSNTAANYHIIPISRVQSFSVLNAASTEAVKALEQPVGPPNIKAGKERAERKVKELQDQEASLGKGVTKEAQAIFDALKRVNIPIRWHDQQMIAHEAVIIAPPYRPEDCRGAKEKQQTLNQVKRVLEGERRKLKEREERKGG